MKVENPSLCSSDAIFQRADHYDVDIERQLVLPFYCKRIFTVCLCCALWMIAMHITLPPPITQMHCWKKKERDTERQRDAEIETERQRNIETEGNQQRLFAVAAVECFAEPIATPHAVGVGFFNHT